MSSASPTDDKAPQRDVLKKSGQKPLRAMFTRKRVLLLLLVGLIAVIAWTQIPPYMKARAYAESDAKAVSIDRDVVAANTRFAVSLLKELNTEDKGQNIFFSPLSVSTALTMAYNGAEGTTKDAMGGALGIGSLTLDKVNAGNQATLDSLATVDDSIQLSIANSVWIVDSFAPSIRAEYLKRVTDYYRSVAYTRSFADPKTVTEINNWISGKTQGKINKMLERIDSSDIMFLINAIYFKGDWVSPFDEAATRLGVFHLADGSTRQVNYMYKTNNLQYQKGDGFAAARLPYGRDKVAMYVLLPDESSSVNALTGSLTGQKLDDIFSKFSDRKLAVQLPKFKVEYGTKRLNAALTRMGMGVAFDRANANFNGIAPVTPSSNLFINYVDHKAYVDVNEKGTEAAAATIISIGVTSTPFVTQFKVDRPFLFLIRDDRSGSILFIGEIMNPAA